jgi:FkbM family methyltransferase
MSILQPGSLVFDIGAHHGESAARFILDHGARSVVCLEPSLPNFLALRTRWDKDPRVTTIHAAMATAPSLLEVFHSTFQDGLSTTDPSSWRELYPDAEFQRGELVTALSYSQLVAHFGQPELFKVDVEGAEYQVLRGLTVPAHHMPRVVTFEFHGSKAHDAISCLYLLGDLGFSLALMETEEPSLMEMPVDPLTTVIERFKADPPDWGNFTIM